MKAMISITVPIYNCETTLHKCLESIRCQTYTNYEVILIDDGSTDNSGKICEKYSQVDSRVQVVHQSNKGVSSARNKGIDMATGEYLTFVDADDYLDKEHLAKLLKAIHATDIGAVGLYNVKDGLIKKNILSKSYRWSSEEFFYHVVADNHIGGYLCNKLFISDIIKKNNIRMKENIKVSEDMLFICDYLQYCKRGGYINIPTYYYVSSNNSAMREMYKTQKFDRKKMSTLDAADEILKLGYAEGGRMEEGSEYRFIRARLWALMNMIFCRFYDAELIRRIKSFSGKQIKSYFNCPFATTLEKICVVMMRICPSILYFFGVTIGRPFSNIIKKKILN